MESSIATPKETALANLSEDEQKLLAQAKQELGGNSRPFIPQLKLSTYGSKTEIPKGHFYLVVQEEVDGEKERKEIDIGENPDIIIMKRMYAYSRYSKAKDRLLNWTNEIEGFSEEDIVYLVNAAKGRPYLEFRGSYPEFRDYKQANYYDADEGRSKLSFTNVLYVYVEHPDTDKRIFRFFVRNSSVTGIPEGEQQGNYDKPEPDSLQAFIEGMQKSDPGVFFGTICKLGSKDRGGGDIPFKIVTFENAGPVADLSYMLKLWHALNKALRIRFKDDFESLPSEPTGDSSDVIDVEVDDLPDL